MLKELGRLTVETDGRYATASELQFIKDYLESAEKRVSAYEKIRNSEETIIHRVETEKRKVFPEFFKMGEDYVAICNKNMRALMRFATAAMLVNDLDHLREVLLWYNTIVRSFKYEKDSEITFPVFQEVMKMYLTAEEAAMIIPAFQVNYTILS
ncbi:MAG: allophycocyanin [Gomphosphaeria aponina SAG 52.96 = DSM 107014]|uniref:Allophycocyanin n=1 Tax=Gomphosphaeria aponina SAG 52.96 = DSM 107014 TaxID=1521640 RepID=A0A941GTK9_9CHRO|nr:allophycocyanin [Gomphosphaeria aponina SAG 52.96 = DSM 107014]